MLSLGCVVSLGSAWCQFLFFLLFSCWRTETFLGFTCPACPSTRMVRNYTLELQPVIKVLPFLRSPSHACVWLFLFCLLLGVSLPLSLRFARLPVGFCPSLSPFFPLPSLPSPPPLLLVCILHLLFRETWPAGPQTFRPVPRRVFLHPPPVGRREEDALRYGPVGGP